jgi:hypothetical protein
MKETLFFLLKIYGYIGVLTYIVCVFYIVAVWFKAEKIIETKGKVTFVGGATFNRRSSQKMGDYLTIVKNIGFMFFSVIWPVLLFMLFYNRSAFKMIEDEKGGAQC